MCRVIKSDLVSAALTRLLKMRFVELMPRGLIGVTAVKLVEVEQKPELAPRPQMKGRLVMILMLLLLAALMIAVTFRLTNEKVNYFRFKRFLCVK